MPHKSKMFAVVHTDAYHLDLRHVPVPQTEYYDDALIKVGSVGICGSDKHDLDHKPGVEQIPGHEFAGVIEELGDEPGRFKLGDRVVVKPQARCGECDNCRQYPRLGCDKGGVYGCAGNQPPGAMAEYVLVGTDNLTPIPDDISLEEAALADPLAVAIYSIDLGPDVRGQNCVVTGAGVIGMLLAQVLKLRGAERVALVDVVPSHLELARSLGHFECYLADDSERLAESLRDVKAGIYYELAGGESPALNLAVNCIENSGHIILVSQRPKGVWLDYQWIIWKGLHLHGVAGTSQKAWDEALDIIFNKQAQVLPLVTHRFPLEQANEALAAAYERESLKVMIKPNGEVV